MRTERRRAGVPRADVAVRLRHDLGGEHFLDPVALGALVPFLLFASVVERSADVGDVPGWILANVLAFGACAAIVVALRRATRRRRTVRPLPIVATPAVGAVLGPVKLVLTERCAGLLDLVSADVGLRAPLVAQVVVLAAVQVPGVVFMRAALDRLRVEHRLLVAHTLDTAIAADGGPGLGPDRAAVTAALGALRAELAAAPPGRAAGILRTAVESRLRPLIHRLWAASHPVVSDLTVRGLLRAALRRPVTAVAAPVLVHVAVVALFLLRVLPVDAAVPRVVVAAGTLAIVLLATRAATRRLPDGPWGPPQLAATIAAVVVLQSIGPFSVTSLPQLSVTAAAVLLTGWLLVLLVGTAVVTTALADRDALRAHLLAGLGPERYAALSRAHVDASAARELADRLHADLQGSLLVAAGRLERLPAGEPAVADELARVDALLAAVGSRPGEGAGAARDLSARLTELVARWDGFLAVDVAGDLAPDPGPLPARTADALVRIVAEALTNAHRHGGAERASVRIARDPGGVQIIIEDDGIGLRRGRRGVGSAHLDAVAPGGWTRTARTEGGTRLDVRIPVTEVG